MRIALPLAASLKSIKNCIKPAKAVDWINSTKSLCELIFLVALGPALHGPETAPSAEAEADMSIYAGDRTDGGGV